MPSQQTSEPEPVIQCRQLWKVFGPKARAVLHAGDGAPCHIELSERGITAAVRDIDLDIYRNEILVIMGLSGSGKSTFLRCLTRLLEADKGTIHIEGQDLLALSEKSLIQLRRSKMGMVFQSFALLPHRSVLENIAFPLQMRGQNKKTREARALKMIQLVGLEGKENHYPRELSGGQQQRVGIARSLAIEPDLWFLDEPFSALDPLIRREMQDEFLRLQSLLGKTIVFVTHDFDEALRLADRIVIMYQGRIEQVAPPSDIVLHPATEYVAKFTRNIAKARVIKASDLAEPLDHIPASGQCIPAHRTLASLSAQLMQSDAPYLALTDGSGTAVSQLSRERALSLLCEEALE